MFQRCPWSQHLGSRDFLNKEQKYAKKTMAKKVFKKNSNEIPRFGLTVCPSPRLPHQERLHGDGRFGETLPGFCEAFGVINLIFKKIKGPYFGTGFLLFAVAFWDDFLCLTFFLRAFWGIFKNLAYHQ